ncbi:MAG: 4Fe-4S cluster-binding domain-containing protein [Clostridia bacterium]|nr:4Fe-4S cluster-binding domain-containing protein [Clostridia bacterium]
MVIFTTLGCNANCYYCYENNLRNNKYKMSKETADKIISLLIKNNKKKISIGWFGGEPLYNEEIIDYISD